MTKMRMAATAALLGALVFGFLMFVALVGAGTAGATPPGEDGEHKVTICHRTHSDTNPYVFIEVDEASLSPGHLDNADPGHKPTFWKTDGTWRGVAHVAGDPKDDYLATTAADCEDIVVTPTPTPTPTPTQTPPPPTEPPTVPPTHEPKPPKHEPNDCNGKNCNPGPVAFTGFDALDYGLVALGLALLGGGAWYLSKKRTL